MTAPEIVLDLSRLLSRVLHPTPTGIDRVELAYARELLVRAPERLSFGAVHPLFRRYGRIPATAASDFIRRTEAAWSTAPLPLPERRRAALRALLALRPRAVPPLHGPRVLVQASPHHLDDAPLVRAILGREQARFLCLLHDLIPITHPEYARRGGGERHLRRVETLAEQADGLLANSQATLDDAARFLPRGARRIITAVAHLGLDMVTPLAADRRHEPYFVCLGTIEPRKNHLLLLHLWRALAQERGASCPRLLLAGRRGWENEQVVDLLERAPALRGCVEEVPGLGDADVRALLSGARALLMPSFAEGFGMPVPEALALGVPVLCSDLPALREAGGDAPLFLDPLDGPGWRRAILDLVDDAPAAQAAHAARRAEWRPTTWDAHMTRLLEMVQEIAA